MKKHEDVKIIKSTDIVADECEKQKDNPAEEKKMQKEKNDKDKIASFNNTSVSTNSVKYGDRRELDEEHFTPDEHLKIHHTITVNINRLRQAHSLLASRISILEEKKKPIAKAKNSSKVSKPKCSKDTTTKQVETLPKKRSRSKNPPKNATENATRFKRLKESSCDKSR